MKPDELIKNWLGIDHQSMLDDLQETENSLRSLEEEMNGYEMKSIKLLEEQKRLAKEFEFEVKKKSKEDQDFKEKFLEIANKYKPADELSQKKWREINKQINLIVPPSQKNVFVSKWEMLVKWFYRTMLRVFRPLAYRRHLALKYLMKIDINKKFRRNIKICNALQELLEMRREGLNLEDRFNVFIISLHNKSPIDEDTESIITELNDRAQRRLNALSQDTEQIARSHKELAEEVIFDLNFSPSEEIELAQLDSLPPNLLDDGIRSRLGSLKAKENLFMWLRTELKTANWILRKVNKNLDLTKEEEKLVKKMRKHVEKRVLKSYLLSQKQNRWMAKLLRKAMFDQQYQDQQKAEIFLLEKRKIKDPTYEQASEKLLNTLQEHHESSLSSVLLEESDELDVIIEFARRAELQVGENALVVIKTSAERRREDYEALETMKTFTNGNPGGFSQRKLLKIKLFKSQIVVTEKERKEIQKAARQTKDKIQRMTPKQLAIEILELSARNTIFPEEKESETLLIKLLNGFELDPLESLTVYSFAKEYQKNVIGRMNEVELAFFTMSSAVKESPLCARLRRSCLDVNDMFSLAKASKIGKRVSQEEWLNMLLGAEEKPSSETPSTSTEVEGEKIDNVIQNVDVQKLFEECERLLIDTVTQELGGKEEVLKVFKTLEALDFGSTTFQQALIVSKLNKTERKEILSSHNNCVIRKSVGIRDTYSKLIIFLRNANKRLWISKFPLQNEITRKKLAFGQTKELQPAKRVYEFYTELVNTFKNFLNEQHDRLGLEGKFED
ncbi:hypothetical protein CROQUDRAFT_45347 [Cronartium quercuum f. sp. fusiforme G11]|uniref:Uncharacterized protein n=1 Tax=Cronartium quercuum f. sp. fusiforme G11 TaxID=708437 RepID=A0A9P6NF60_9BASI|nr:hypothetical protein CROQUDRAFT_45347 [Cronartium quercuum f. sp. fusiforme G11]